MTGAPLDAAVAVLAVAQVLVVGAYLIGAAVDAGVGVLAGAARRVDPALGGAALSVLGPLPLLDAVWAVAAAGLLLGGFPAVESALLGAAGPVLLLGQLAAIALVVVLALRRVGDEAGLGFTRAAPVVSGLVLAVTASTTWVVGATSWPVAVTGALAQALASVAVAAAFCVARLRGAEGHRWSGALHRARRRSSLIAAGAASLLAGAAALDGRQAPALLAALAAALLVARTRGVRSGALGAVTAWALVVGPQLAGAVPFLLRSSTGDPATTAVLATVVVATVPLLLLGQGLVWWWAARRLDAAASTRSW